MKNHLALLLASVLLVFALTACGGTDKNGNTTPNGTNDNAVTDNNGGTVGEDVGNAIDNAGDAIQDTGNAIGDAVTGNNAAPQRARGGYANNTGGRLRY